MPDGGVTLSWREAGDPSGPVVVYFHGTGSEQNVVLFPDLAEALGVRVLMPERPGYGASTPIAAASLIDVARMVLDDLDARGIDRFSVLGWSGGGPHALACAAIAPERVRAVGLFASWAPMNPPDPGLPAGVRFAMRVATKAPRPVLRLMFRAGRQTSIGMVDDVRRVARPWQFEIAPVTASVPVFAWHAETDPEVPIAPWRNIPGVELTVLPGSAHDPPRDAWRDALRLVTDPR